MVRDCHYLGGFDGRILIDLLGAPLTLVGAVKVHRDARFVGSIESLDFGLLHDVQKVAKIVGSILEGSASARQDIQVSVVKGKWIKKK